MGKKNQKLNIPKELLEELYLNQLLTTKQISEKLVDYGYECGWVTVINYLEKYNIPKRTRSEITTIQIARAKEEDYEGYMASRARAGESNSKIKRAKGFEELSRLSKKSRATYYANRTEEQARRDRELQRRRGEAGRAARRAKGTFGTGSSEEEEAYYIILKEYFGDDNVIHGYRDERYVRSYDRYQYNCDFYIPSLDLFIEYNGFYTHGTEPFDKNNSKHQELLEDYKARNINMRVWYDCDVKKVNTAKRHGLNLLSVYPNNKLYLTSKGRTQALVSLADLQKYI